MVVAARALAAAAISLVALPVVATVAIGATGLSSAPAGAVNSPLSCAPGTIYNLTTSGQFYALNTSTSVDTPAVPATVGAGESSPNALAISSDGATVFATDQNNTGTGSGSDTTTVDMENVQTASNQTFTNMPATNIAADDVVSGGVDPVNGFYYYGGWNDAATEFYLFAFNPTTHTAAQAGTVTPANGGNWSSGDLAFDGSGNLYVLAGTLTSGEILTVPGPVPTSGTAALTNKVLGSFSGGGNIDGVAFAADGTLYAEDFNADLDAINPNTGAVTTLAHQSGISGPDDLASCAYNGSLKLQKDVVGRVGANDQFTVSIAQGSSTLSTGTTSGTGTGTQTGPSEIAGPVVGIPTTQYTISEAGASGANLANYASSYSCLNGTTSFASGSGTSALLPAFPAASSASGAQIVCTFTNTPASIALTKTPSPSAVSSAGQHVTYTFAFTNTGPLTLTNVDVTDAQTAPSSNANLSAVGNCVVGSTPETNGSITLAAGASGSCTATYTVQAADLAQRSIADIGTVTGTAPGGGTVSANAPASVSVTANPSITISKAASVSSISAPGTITYTFTVTNTGNVGLTAADVTDSLNTGTLGTIACTGLTNPTAGCSGDSVALAPGQVASFSATLPVTQAMIDAGGKITDTGSVSANTPTGVTPTSVSGSSNPVSVTVVQNPALTTTKTVTSTGPYNTVGQAVTYNFAVKNTGNVDISNVGVSDVPTLTSGPTCTGLVNPTAGCSGSTVATLAPGQTANFSGTYHLTQADLDNGSVSDTGTACGTAPNATSQTCSNGSTVTITTSETGGITISKAASVSSISAPGTITYTFTVTNTSNVHLTAADVTDSLNTGTLGTIACTGLTNPTAGCSGDSVALAPGQVASFSATLSVTQAMIDAGGKITDTGSVSANTPTGITPATVSGTSNPVSVTVVQNPALTTTKTVTSTGPYNTVGQAVTYNFAVKNTGNVDISNVGVSDVPTLTSGPTCTGLVNPTAPCSSATTVATLAPGQTANFSGTYDLTQADLDNGSVRDTGTACGTAPNATSQTCSNGSTVTITTQQNPSLSIVKSASPGVVHAPGQVVTYTFDVTNTGNVTINGIQINDTQEAPASQANLTTPMCPQSSLAPKATENCMASYTVTSTDLANGSITDSATASGTTKVGTTVTSPPSMATVLAVETVMSGRAYALSLGAGTPGLAAIGPMTVQDTGGTDTALSTTTPNPCEVDANVLDVAITGDVCSSVTTSADNPETSTASSSIANAAVSIGTIPVIKVQAVQSSSTTTCAGSSGSVTIAYLAVGNTVLINKPTQVAPNTGFNVGIVSLVVNQQTPFSLGGDHGLTVYAVHATVTTGLLNANVVVAASISDIDCAAPFASPLLTGEANVANLTASALGKSVLGDITVNDSGPILTQTPYITPTPCVATAHVPDLAFTGDACAGVNTTATTSTATASVANATLTVPNVVPTIVLKGVQSQSATSCTGSSGSVTIAYLKVGSTVVINSPEQVAPNTKVVVGTVTLLLNRQTAFSIGGDTGLTVNAIAISVNGGAVATADLTIANSTSDIIGCH